MVKKDPRFRGDGFLSGFCSFWLLFFLIVTPFAGAFDHVVFGKDEEAGTLGTFFAGGFAVEQKFAFRIFGTGIKNSAFAFSFHHFAFTTFRTDHAGAFLNFFDIFAFRVAGTSEETAEPAEFDYHGKPALIANFPGIFRNDLLLFGHGPGEFTFRIIGAGNEFAEPAEFKLQRMAGQWA